jgi:hypothetical protein
MLALLSATTATIFAPGLARCRIHNGSRKQASNAAAPSNLSAAQASRSPRGPEVRAYVHATSKAMAPNANVAGQSHCRPAKTMKAK